MRIFRNFLLPALIILLLPACKQGPKTTEPYTLIKTTHIDKDNGIDIVDRNLHEVKVLEVIPAEKYVYLKVNEKDQEYWIAALKQDVKEGTTYLYNEALLKTKFESKEFNRVFDTLYMVTALVPKGHGKNLLNTQKTPGTTETEEAMVSDPESTTASQGTYRGAVKIVDLLKNPKEYEGDIVQISGECTKINTGILGRNWIHIIDGSRDDYDLVITTNEGAQKGSLVTIRGTVTLNKDFGGGYSYEVLLENGTVVQ